MDRREKYCPYCQTNSHSIVECRKQPRPDFCYDCLRMNCRRGQPGCPGRINMTRGRIAGQSPIIDLDANHHVLDVMLDTGSNVSLLKLSAAEELGLEIKHNSRIPPLQGITGHKLRVLG